MKNFHSVHILICLLLCISFSGCRSFNKADERDDGSFPASVGSFERKSIFKEEETNYLNEKNKSQKFKSKKAQYKDGDDQITYGISTHQKAEDALNEQENESRSGNNTAWKNLDLKDKTGKNVGKLTISRKYENSSHDIAGNTNYSLAFNIDNQNHFVNVYTLSWKPQTTDRLVAFVKALPVAAQLDLSFLDVITSGNADKIVTEEKIAAISPPNKPVSAPYLKGKTVVFLIKGSYSGLETENWIKDGSRQAFLMDEVGSIVRIECGKGPKVGEYTVKESNLTIPAYSSVCKVAIIDNTIPAVIAQKSYTNSTLTDFNVIKTDKKGQIYERDKEYLVPPPDSEIKEFLEKLPKK